MIFFDRQRLVAAANRKAAALAAFSYLVCWKRGDNADGSILPNLTHFGSRRQNCPVMHNTSSLDMVRCGPRPEEYAVRRRHFITLIGSAAAWRVAARAQLPIRRIGHLAIAAPTDTPPPPPANWHAFVQGLREIGYMEGQNIAFEHRSAHDQPELFPKFALELANLKVEVIFARGTWALAAAKNATRTIPIVGIDLEIDPVEAGLVASIARPEGNITGLFLDLSELSGKHLQILKEIIPGASRVAVLGDPVINAPQLREMERVARALAIQTKALETVNGVADLGH